MPATSFSSCVLPAPFAPTSTQRCPGRMVQVIPRSTARPARRTVAPARRTSRYRVPDRFTGALDHNFRSDYSVDHINPCMQTLGGPLATAAAGTPLLAHLG